MQNKTEKSGRRSRLNGKVNGPDKNTPSDRTGYSNTNPGETAESTEVPYFSVNIAERYRNPRAAISGNGHGTGISSDSQLKLYRVQGQAIDLLLKSYNAMIELSAVRLECKLSNTRASGVARELRELIKVMSVYDC